MNFDPYSELPPSAFWKTGVAHENPYFIDKLYRKKFTISGSAKIGTAGSCFAQHITQHLRKNGYKILDVEPAPAILHRRLHRNYGFSTYSARYGNIYTVKQLLQLAQEAAGEWTPVDWIWENSGKYFDALRPAVEPDGLDSPEEVIEHRAFHISQVRRLFEEIDVLIFTLGLTEAWIHRASGTVYPTAPGTISGVFDPKIHAFKNYNFNEIVAGFLEFLRVVEKLRKGRPFDVILTVSPVPLTATASGEHVLVSTAYSKAVLRSVAGQLSVDNGNVDYFPSFEIVTNPRLHSTAFAENLRSVRNETVQSVMNHFFSEHPPRSEKYATEVDGDEATEINEDIQCEEAILEAFAK